MTDRELKEHVQNALDWEPSVDQSDIGVSADAGVVTLRGNVRSFTERSTAERVTLRVYGVKALANDLEVRLPSTAERTDTDIAQAVVTAMAWNTVVPPDRVTVTVTRGWVTLKGSLEWQYQKDAAARVVRDLTGVRGVNNEILVKPHIKTEDVQAKIEAAFRRSAEIDARRVSVAAQDGKVILTGNVRSWAERQEAERAAWAAPGVTQVDDRITITL
jgi:osmotically-inducible protein OsmY